MSDINLGTLLTENQPRDAIHFAIACVFSDEILMPGQHVGLVKGSITQVEPSKRPIGIVDPFLTKPVPAGSLFWLMLYQKTVTNMRHEWEHPEFAINKLETIMKAAPAPKKKVAPAIALAQKEDLIKLESEKWLRNFCDGADCPGFDAVMEKAIEIADGGSGSDWDDDYMYFQDSDAHGDIPAEFWVHVERYLGRPIKGKKATAFTCSC